MRILVAGVIANRLAEVIRGSLEESHVHGSTKLLEDLIRGERLRLAGLEGSQSVFGLLGPKTCSPAARRAVVKDLTRPTPHAPRPTAQRTGPDVNRSLRDDVRFATRRRGVTLVEMLVTLAILLLMMTVIVQIFQAATGALNAAQVYQELDNQLRLLDSTIRSDLGGVTCKLTPPNDPKNNPGYLEYGENEFADVQGEDADDYIRFTAKAPAGRPFTGRMWVPPPNSALLTAQQAINLFEAGYQPITITSDYAEIIYFLRNGNLYRRVLLVAPERQSVVVPTVSNQATIVYNNNGTPPNLSLMFNPTGLNGYQVSWQAMNDLSAHPAPTGDPTALGTYNSVVLNTLANLTNRENRWAYQRFANDFQNNLTGAGGPDNLADDFNGDNVPDYYPTLYSETVGNPPGNPPTSVFTNPNTLIFESPPAPGPLVPNYRNLMAFPYVFPGAYSRPQTRLPSLTQFWA